MNIRLSRLAKTTLVVAVTLLMSGRSWAIYNVLGPAKDEWGLKYDVEVKDDGGNTVTVEQFEEEAEATARAGLRLTAESGGAIGLGGAVPAVGADEQMSHAVPLG